MKLASLSPPPSVTAYIDSDIYLITNFIFSNHPSISPLVYTPESNSGNCVVSSNKVGIKKVIRDKKKSQKKNTGVCSLLRPWPRAIAFRLIKAVNAGRLPKPLCRCYGLRIQLGTLVEWLEPQRIESDRV